MCFLQHALQHQNLLSGSRLLHLRHLPVSELIVSLVDLGDLEARVARSTAVINALERAVNSVLRTRPKVSLCSSLVTVGYVVVQSVPAAHDGDGSLAHCVFAFVFRGVELGCWMFNAEWTFNSASSVWVDPSVRML
jgi:hypothetical protein